MEDIMLDKTDLSNTFIVRVGKDILFNDISLLAKDIKVAHPDKYFIFAKEDQILSIKSVKNDDKVIIKLDEDV